MPGITAIGYCGFADCNCTEEQGGINAARKANEEEENNRKLVLNNGVRGDKLEETWKRFFQLRDWSVDSQVEILLGRNISRAGVNSVPQVTF